MVNIILHEPVIPQNTGNIARTCAATGSRLHLIEPLGFFIDDKSVKRAGLDYWDKLDVVTYTSFDDFCAKNKNAMIYMATTKAKNTYTQVEYPDNCFIMFGKETAGIPEEILVKYPNTSIRIPMKNSIRSLNLSNSVAIILFEALRQQSFDNLKPYGELTNYTWD